MCSPLQVLLPVSKKKTVSPSVRSSARVGLSVYIDSRTHTLCFLESSTMDPRPSIARGDYFYTKGYWSRIRCKGYTAPFPDGFLIETVAPNTYLGPSEAFLDLRDYRVVLINGWWINVWQRRKGRSTGVCFADKVPRYVVSNWHSCGWVDIYQ